jgi:colicin import membrane protein
MRALLLVVLTLAAPVHAGTPLAPLQAEQARAERLAAEAAAAREAQRQAVVDRFAEIEAAAARVRGALAERAGDAKLGAAMDALARGKAGYDAALGREREAMIASVQADAAARAARQALTDAVTGWMAQGEALERAAMRAAAGEVVPSPRESASCLERDCSPIPPREHAALATMGAVGPAFASQEWTSEAGATNGVFPLDAAAETRIRNLRAAAADATAKARANQDALSVRRPPLAAALPAWEAALKTLLDAYFRPQANSHAEENLAMAAEGYEMAAANLRPQTQAYRAASLAVDATMAAPGIAAARLDAAVATFGDIGRAVQRAARLAGRGYRLAAAGKGWATCRDRDCIPAAGLEAAAFVVIGAAAPGVEKGFDGLLVPTADRRWVFKLP